MQWTSSWSFLGLPLIDVRFGRPDGEAGWSSSWAMGWIAIGGCAVSPLIALGGLAIGGVGFGGLAIGIVAVGGMGLGYWSAAGTAVGLFALGGMSLGWHWAVGGMAFANHAALGGLAFGEVVNDEAAWDYVRANTPLDHGVDLLRHLAFTLVLAIPLGIVARTRGTTADDGA